MRLLYHNFELKQEDISEDGGIVGYASVYGNRDFGGDIVEKGAFKNSLKKRPINCVKMLWQHQPDKPIGVWKKAEDDSNGLRITGQIAVKTQKGAEAYELLRMGAIDGLSIGFYIVDSIERKDARIIKEAELLEVSLVTFPMNPQAIISSVKSNNNSDLLHEMVKFKQFLTTMGAK